METLFSLRFFGPPAISLIFIVIAVPDMVREAFVGGLANPVFATAALFVLMAGYLVSSIATFLINVLSLDIIAFNKEEITALREVYPFLNKQLQTSNNAKELAEWLLLDRTGGDYIRLQMQSRWNQFLISFSSYIALLIIVLPAIMYLRVWPDTLWWVLYVAAVLVFFYNASSFFKNVNDVTRLLVHKSKADAAK